MFLYSAALFLAGCGGDGASSSAPAAQSLAATATDTTTTVAAGTTSTVALAGNAFITSAPAGAEEIIDDNGLANWSNANAVTSAYFRMASAGSVTIGLTGYLAGSNNSTVRVTVNGTPFTVALAGTTAKTYAVGTVNVAAPGYVKVDLQGISKDGGYFGDVSALTVTTTATVNYANDAANYYWSRRGPSVHMGYTTPSDTQYFYNEVTIPTGQDPVGSYFMANGFSQGYFGIQVNSSTERRILFSVWDADSGAKTTLVSKGTDVVDNTFGGEGTGGQSYLVYNWVAGNTYRFITRATPDGAGATNFSAWFYAPESSAWRYIATWKRPETSTYLTGNYSFLENFSDTNGYTGRRVLYGNQWARNASGTWSEVTTARLTGDATVTNAQRMDYAGGLDGGRFYLRNGGFFADYVPVNQNFTRPATGQQPTVDVNSLPQ
ncbi:DUF5077 domain-containing protein [Duganella sp. FT80W]|uniref:DUF5077 domain-containing protein n=2 Tax=Duganella guangzhouensis TaxID=2666084 RepID=A0A6I2KW21_9BURK|nr:DUF5077 domain-containing protein [Duganella guangzhouensis]